MNNMRHIGGLTLLLVLSACGGGGGSDGPGAPPYGLYQGSSSNGRTLAGLVLDDGSYYVIYTAANNPSLAAGFIQGIGTYNNGKFSSSNGKDFNLEGYGISPLTFTVDYAAKQSLSGTIGSITFSSQYSSNYDKTATLTELAGTYTGQVGYPGGSDTATVTINSSGNVSGTTGATGCTFSGLATPKSSGNAYIVSISFDTAACIFYPEMMTGAAYYDAATKMLRSVHVNGAKSKGFLFIGSKP